jgi:ferric-dicitrate binding protein FerR (iron transport regulator)
MSNKVPADPANDERLLEDILRHATKRPQPSAAARERALRELRGEWQALTSARKRRRRFAALGVAASFAVAVFGGLQWFAAPSPGVEWQVTVQRVAGDALNINSERLTASSAAGRELARGDQLATGPGSQVAIRWGQGSLRLDSATRVTLLDAQTISLLRGAVYFDSRPFSSDTAASIVVQTGFGEISHLGTQFQAHIDDDGLRLQVREGAVDIRGPRVDVQLSAGEALHVGQAGDVRRVAIASNDPDWQWAAEIAPELQLDGRSTAEVLGWIGRETGQRVVYRSEKARQLAASEARGIGTLAPLPALRTIPYMTSLEYSIVDDVIAVDARESPPANP